MARSPSSNGSKQLSPLGSILFGTVWTLFSSIFVCIGLWVTWKGASQSIWKKVPCVIERFEIRADRNKSPVFQPDLKFRYEWDGRSYTGIRLRPDGDGSDKFDDVSEIREKLLAEAGRETPQGLRTECRVDPGNPEQSSLFPPNGSNWLGLVFVAIGGGFMAIGLSIVFSGFKNRGRASLSDQAKRTSQSPIPLFVFFGIFAAAGLGVTLGVVMPAVNRYFSAKSWIETPATVIWSRVKSHSGSKGGTTYSVDVFYRYQFQGREYRSNTYGVMSGSSSGRDGKQEIADSLPAGSTLTCYVNPQKPWQAIVNRNPGASALFVLFPLPFLGIGIGGMIWSLKKRRNEKAQRIDSITRSQGLVSEALIPDLPERVLFSGKSRWINLSAALFVCAFWNGIVSVFVGIAWNAWKKGNPETFLMIFLIPFVLIGTALLLNVPYRLLMVFLARYELRLTPGTLKPGGSATLNWKRVGGFGEPKSISLRLTGTEVASWQNGKSRSRATSFFHDEVLADLSLNSISANRPIAIKLPENALPTFKGDSNQLVWKLRMVVIIPGFPKITDDHEIDVRPLRRDEMKPST